ncbi:D-tyrosyl-tRNA(Tyr) deacylase [Artemisia annua]|uniref:D-aminoacyl-tRNA deacylase n=1 Tax=Artemisia annua TaxID=35608 RepID=A0A2U1PBY3_ARTAN|nr:D-tyrosyl-tRNA(Tyr) deacylase [Artemisia annua]
MGQEASPVPGLLLTLFGLAVSQFTLYGILKGNKPDFHVAMGPDRAKSFYASLVERFQRSYKSEAVKDGVFGAMMKVNLVNDGPVTMQLESPNSSRKYAVAETQMVQQKREIWTRSNLGIRSIGVAFSPFRNLKI